MYCKSVAYIPCPCLMCKLELHNELIRTITNMDKDIERSKERSKNVLSINFYSNMSYKLLFNQDMIKHCTST